MKHKNRFPFFSAKKIQFHSRLDALTTIAYRKMWKCLHTNMNRQCHINNPSKLGLKIKLLIILKNINKAHISLLSTLYTDWEYFSLKWEFKACMLFRSHLFSINNYMEVDGLKKKINFIFIYFSIVDTHSTNYTGIFVWYTTSERNIGQSATNTTYNARSMRSSYWWYWSNNAFCW